MQHRVKVLFICSRNKWRSRTAETIYKKDSKLYVKSAGTAQSARVKVDERLVNWADFIFVMEKKHKEFLQQTFSSLNQKKISILEIPDEYKYMDEELIDMIQSGINDFFKKQIN